MKKYTQEEIVRKIDFTLENTHYFYFVIEFKNKCRYHYDPSTGKKNFKFKDILRVNRDIQVNLRNTFNRVIRELNSKKSISDLIEMDLYEARQYGFVELKENAQYKIRYESLPFIGVLEHSSLLSRKCEINQELPQNFHMGYHIHLFVPNPLGLNPNVIRETILSTNHNWRKNIHSITQPKTKKEIHTPRRFRNYHLKQSDIENRVMVDFIR